MPHSRCSSPETWWAGAQGAPSRALLGEGASCWPTGQHHHCDPRGGGRSEARAAWLGNHPEEGAAPPVHPPKAAVGGQARSRTGEGHAPAPRPFRKGPVLPRPGSGQSRRKAGGTHRGPSLGTSITEQVANAYHVPRDSTSGALGASSSLTSFPTCLAQGIAASRPAAGCPPGPSPLPCLALRGGSCPFPP